MVAFAIVFGLAMIAFGVLGYVSSYKLHNYLEATHPARHRQIGKGGDVGLGFIDVLRFHRYVWSQQDNADAQVLRLKRRLRLALVGGLGSGILGFAIPVGLSLLVEFLRR